MSTGNGSDTHDVVKHAAATLISVAVLVFMGVKLGPPHFSEWPLLYPDNMLLYASFGFWLGVTSVVVTHAVKVVKSYLR